MKNGSMVFGDFEENFEKYMNEWDVDTDERQEFSTMVFEKNRWLIGALLNLMEIHTIFNMCCNLKKKEGRLWNILNCS